MVESANIKHQQTEYNSQHIIRGKRDSFFHFTFKKKNKNEYGYKFIEC